MLVKSEKSSPTPRLGFFSSLAIPSPASPRIDQVLLPSRRVCEYASRAPSLHLLAMEPTADAQSGTSGDGGAARKPDLGDFLAQLNLEDEVFDDLVIDEDDPEINKSV